MRKLLEHALALASVGIPAAVLVGCGFGLGQVVAHDAASDASPAPTSTTIDAGAELERAAACNVQVENGNPTYSLAVDAPKLDDDLVPAVDDCFDWQLMAWNDAQEAAGSSLRTCRLDFVEYQTAIRVELAPCLAPVDFN